MSVVANVLIASSNANVYIDSVAGISISDCVFTNTVPRSENIRVSQIFTSANIVKLSANLSTEVADTVSFQRLVSNVGLYGTTSFESVFLKSSPSYTTNIDPRLPKYDFLTSNLSIWSNAEIAVGNISLFPIPSVNANTTVFANTYYSNGFPISSNIWIPLSSTTNIVAGDKIVTANIPSTANSTVQKVFANVSVLVKDLQANANIVIAANELVYFYPKTRNYRIMRTVATDTLISNTVILSLETIDDIKVSGLVSTANIVESVSDDTVTTVKKIFNNNSAILVENIDANIVFSVGEYVNISTKPTVGAVRIASEVIFYEQVYTANSRLTNLTRNVGGTTNSTLNGNLTAGNLVSILGLR